MQVRAAGRPPRRAHLHRLRPLKGRSAGRELLQLT
jgi:hypothetical protein